MPLKRLAQHVEFFFFSLSCFFTSIPVVIRFINFRFIIHLRILLPDMTVI